MSQNNANTNEIKPVPLEEEMKKSYLDYAMSVIVSRALPDVRDGLKPVHRRILYAMKTTGNDYNKPHRKSARVVGEVMSKYHPHGNSPIYDAIVRLTQDFSLRAPLIDGQGNFGSLDGDPAAAERYTEARLSHIAHFLLEDIEKETIDYKLNYDETEMEPLVLPARFPNLLINGSSGIAVGMATSIPTHNLGEIIDACVYLIDNPEATIQDILPIVPGPDFPTGGIIMGVQGIREAFRTGRGSLVLRSKVTIETNAKDKRQSIVVTEIPYQVNKSRLVEKIAELVKDKTIEGISDLRDESNRKGVRIVIDLKRDANAEVIENQLYRYSQLQTSVSYNMLALRQGRPEQLGLIDVLNAFIEFRQEVVIRRTMFELRKAREKAHLLIGFAVAISHIDELIDLIKTSTNRAQAKQRLLEKKWDSFSIKSILEMVEEKEPTDGMYQFSELQADAILDLRLHRITSMERDKITNDLNEIIAAIREFISILSNKQKILDIIKEELAEIKNLFHSERRSEIQIDDSSFDDEDLIPQEDMVITVSHGGYIKRVPLTIYRAQRRGGRGRSGMTVKIEDAIHTLIVGNTHHHVYFFTTLGRVFRMKVYKLPIGSPISNGRAIVNLLPIVENEKLATIMICESEDLEDKFFMFTTSKGNVRRNSVKDFASIQSNGKKAMKLDDDEQLVGVALCSENEDIMLSTQNGLCNRFNVDKIRVFQSRDSNGVIGIRLSSDDKVISMTVIPSCDAENSDERRAYLKLASKLRNEEANEELGVTENSVDESEDDGDDNYQLSTERFNLLKEREQLVLSITDKGYGKISSTYDYRTTNRGNVGFSAMSLTNKIGNLVNVQLCSHEDQMMLVTNLGRVIRCSLEDIRITSRKTQGVILMRPNQDEQIVSVSLFKSGIVDIEDDLEEVAN